MRVESVAGAAGKKSDAVVGAQRIDASLTLLVAVVVGGTFVYIHALIVV